MSRGHCTCAVALCPNIARNTTDVMYHSFPRDERLQREWVVRCQRADTVNVKSARVCSVHFHPQDYQRDLRNELLGLPPRKKLMPTAVPSLHLRGVGSTQRGKLGRLRKRLRKCDDNDEGGNMNAVVQQILMNPPEVIIKEEAVVQEEAECDVGAAAQQNFEYVSVKEEPIEDPDESTSPAPEELCEHVGQDQELPLIIKEEIDCDDYIDPYRIS